ncbi:hypothetical protein D3C72_2143620 [compost metagenome]
MRIGFPQLHQQGLLGGVERLLAGQPQAAEGLTLAVVQWQPEGLPCRQRLPVGEGLGIQHAWFHLAGLPCDTRCLQLAHGTFDKGHERCIGFHHADACQRLHLAGDQ